MTTRKNVVLLFSKVPEPGLVKTRLSTLKDGVFSPEIASYLYHCMLFDVVEVISSALTKLEQVSPTSEITDSYELIISTSPEQNLGAMRTLFEEAGSWPKPIMFDTDTGESFDAHYNDAFVKAWARSADTILSMGADMPALTEADIIRGFQALHAYADNSKGGIVLAPDQELGVSIIGWTRQTAFDHTGVFYNPEGLTVLPAYIEKAQRLDLPVTYLPPVPDVDTMADLLHHTTLVQALEYCARFSGEAHPWRTAAALRELGWQDMRIMPNDLRDPRETIDE